MLRVAVFVLAVVALSQAQETLRYQAAGGQGSEARPVNILNGGDNKTPKVITPFVKPAFCNKLECPSYTVKETTADYELREYGPSKWVQTSAIDIDYNVSMYKMFMKLFRYISGSNAARKKIAMTVPVIMRIIPGQGPACENNFTMAFYVAEPDVPAASDDSVKVVTMPTMSAYVKGFSGFATKNMYINTALTLGQKLTEQKKKFDNSYFYTAGYDAPFKLFNRHNEVWFIAM